MADLSIATEVQKVRATQGEQAAELFAASHENGTKWSEEQRKSIEAGAVALTQWSQKADEAVRKQREMTDALKDLKDAARRYQDETNLNVATSGMGSRDQDQYREQQEVERVFDKTDKGAEAVAARASALDALDKKYQQAKASELDWRAGVSAGLADWMDNVSNIAGTVSQGITSTMDSALDNVASMLVRGKADWKEWGLSALEMIAKVSLQMAAVSALGGSSGLLGSLVGSVAGAFGGGAAAAAGATPSGAYTAAAGSLTFNAKGGVYDSPSLSAFSNSIVDTPTFFAFAKGAGVMGEAGPEAIMPLTRAADGSLGVRAVRNGGVTPGGGGAPQVNIHIDGNGNTQTQASGGYEQFGREVGNFVDRRYRELIGRDMSPGGALWNLAKGGR